jgi:hypothetical protein
MAYHFIRIHLKDTARPARCERVESGAGEPVWEIDVVGRKEAEPVGLLVIGSDSGMVHGWTPAQESTK